jgi:hypothetical protein
MDLLTLPFSLNGPLQPLVSVLFGEGPAFMYRLPVLAQMSPLYEEEIDRDVPGGDHVQSVWLCTGTRRSSCRAR